MNVMISPVAPLMHDRQPVSAASGPVRPITRHYAALDGLRGIAAIAVVCLHTGDYFQLRYLPYHAYLAVDFFFMLSGFVIAHAYDKRLATGMGVGTFMKIRLIRLYPMVLLGMLVGLAAFLGKDATSGGIRLIPLLQATAMNLCFLPSPALTYLRPWGFPIDNPLWSLCFEVWINLLYVVIFRFLTVSRLAAILAVGAGLSVWAAVVFHGLNTGFIWATFYTGGARVLFPFFFGVVLARLCLRHRADWPWAHVACLALIAALVAPSFHDAALDPILVLLVFPAILAIAAQASANRVLDPIWQRLGVLSYPLYAIHYPFLVVISNFSHGHHFSPVANNLTALFTVMFVLVIGWLAATLYDAPVRRFLNKRLNRQAPAAV